MILKEEYDTSHKLKYRYLQAEELHECGLLLRLDVLYPDYFAMETDKDSWSDYYIIKLKILEQNTVAS